MRNHAQAMVAADFLVAMTAGFRLLYVLVIMEIGSRRILHGNVTAHPTAGWTLQQFREAIPSDHVYRFLIHDGDSIFSTEVDHELKAFGLKVLRTPVQAPKAFFAEKRHQPNGQQRFSGPLSCHYQCHYSGDSTRLSGRCIVWPCKASLVEYW